MPPSTRLPLALLASVLLAGAAHAQTALTPGNLVVYRVGDNSGTDTLANTGNAVFIDEWNVSGLTPFLVQSIAIPSTGSLPTGSNYLIASGTATSEGMLQPSYGSSQLAFTGYNRATGGASSLPGTTSATVNRSVGVLSLDGTVDTSTSLSNFASASNPRSAVVASTGLYLSGGSNGARLAQIGGSATDPAANLSRGPTGELNNLRGIAAYGGDLYLTSGSGQGGNTFPLGTIAGLPTTAPGSVQTVFGPPGLPTAITGTSYYEFNFFETSQGTVLYIADDLQNAILKFSLVNGTWNANGSVAATAARGLAVIADGDDVRLFASTGGSGTSGTGLVSTFVDNTGFNGAMTGTVTSLFTNQTLSAELFALSIGGSADGSTNNSYAFRGIEIVIPEPSAYAALIGLLSLGLVALRRGRKS